MSPGENPECWGFESSSLSCTMHLYTPKGLRQELSVYKEPVFLGLEKKADAEMVLSKRGIKGSFWGWLNDRHWNGWGTRGSVTRNMLGCHVHSSSGSLSRSLPGPQEQMGLETTWQRALGEFKLMIYFLCELPLAYNLHFIVTIVYFSCSEGS